MCSNAQAAELQYRKEAEDAKAEFDALPATSDARSMVQAGVAAVLPFVSEAWVNGIVAALWVGLFSLGPSVLLRLGIAIMAPITAGYST